MFHRAQTQPQQLLKHKILSLKGCTIKEAVPNPEKVICLESNKEFQKLSNGKREENHSWLTTHKTDEEKSLKRHCVSKQVQVKALDHLENK